MTPYEHARKNESRFLALTSVTIEEFDDLVPKFTAEFEAHMDKWTMEGYPREGRNYSEYKNCPLPGGANKLYFILNAMKQNPTQDEMANKYGMSQSNINKWFHLLHTVLNKTLARAGYLPARTAAKLKALLEQLEQEAASAAAPATGRPKKFSRRDGKANQSTERPI